MPRNHEGAVSGRNLSVGGTFSIRDSQHVREGECRKDIYYAGRR